MKEARLWKSGFSTLCDPEQVTKPLFGLKLLFNHFNPQISPFVLPFVSFFYFSLPPLDYKAP